MTIQLVAARLKPGVSLENAEAEMEGIQARIARENPGAHYDLPKLRMMPLQEKLVGDARLALLILLGAVGFVLLIACAQHREPIAGARRIQAERDCNSHRDRRRDGRALCDSSWVKTWSWVFSAV